MKVKLKVVHHNYSKRLKIHKKLHQEKFLKDVYMLYFHHKMYVLATHQKKFVNRKPKMKLWQVISAVMTSQDPNVYFT